MSTFSLVHHSFLKLNFPVFYEHFLKNVPTNPHLPYSPVCIQCFSTLNSHWEHYHSFHIIDLHFFVHHMCNCCVPEYSTSMSAVCLKSPEYNSTSPSEWHTSLFYARELCGICGVLRNNEPTTGIFQNMSNYRYFSKVLMSKTKK